MLAGAGLAGAGAPRVELGGGRLQFGVRGHSPVPNTPALIRSR